MTDKVETIKTFAQIGFDRLERATQDLKEEQLDWKSCPEANTIRRILTHLSHEIHVYLPRVLSGDKEYTPEGWPEDYVGNTSYSLEKIMEDLENGKADLMKRLGELTAESLSEEIDYFRGKRSREFYANLMISEILHHEGQIAAILGVEKRMKGLA
ncbi:MAG: DinB family protein [Candidatus Bathyarchaeota archaeon]|nr:DinB family protein [Candidatus Bathyarchaeota archaeon]